MHSLKCLNDDTFYKYLDGQLVGKELQRVERHLDECSICLKEFSTFIKLSTAPINDDEKKILEAIERVPVADRVQQLLDQIKIGRVENKRENSKEADYRISKLTDRFKKYQSVFPFPKYVLRPGLAMILMLIIALGIFGFRFYHTGYQVYTAEKLLAQNYRAARNDLRLAGKYSLSPIGNFMGANESSQYLDKVRHKLDIAKRNGVTSSRMTRVYSHFLIINKKYDQADSLLRIQNAENSAAILNDLGVSACNQGKLAQAIDYFQRSLSIDSTQSEVLYNLGLVYSLDNNYKNALRYYKKSLSNETDEQWCELVLDKIASITEKI